MGIYLGFVGGYPLSLNVNTNEAKKVFVADLSFHSLFDKSVPFGKVEGLRAQGETFDIAVIFRSC